MTDELQVTKSERARRFLGLVFGVPGVCFFALTVAFGVYAWSLTGFSSPRDLTGPLFAEAMAALVAVIFCGLSWTCNRSRWVAGLLGFSTVVLVLVSLGLLLSRWSDVYSKALGGLGTLVATVAFVPVLKPKDKSREDHPHVPLGAKRVVWALLAGAALTAMLVAICLLAVWAVGQTKKEQGMPAPPEMPAVPIRRARPEAIPDKPSLEPESLVAPPERFEHDARLPIPSAPAEPRREVKEERP